MIFNHIDRIELCADIFLQTLIWAGLEAERIQHPCEEGIRFSVRHKDKRYLGKHILIDVQFYNHNLQITPLMAPFDRVEYLSEMGDEPKERKIFMDLDFFAPYEAVLISDCIEKIFNMTDALIDDEEMDDE